VIFGQTQGQKPGFTPDLGVNAVAFSRDGKRLATRQSGRYCSDLRARPTRITQLG